MSFVNELKRRNVIRVGVAYLAASWLLIEVSSTLLPLFDIPEWGVRLIVIILALGFVPTLVFSWVYEITPDGLKRETEIVREVSIAHVTAKRLDWITIGIVVVALLFIATDRLWLREEAPQPVLASPESTEVSEQPTIAVLPFANRSANPDDAFFVDGIHFDLLAHLSKLDRIRTISRTSVIGFRDSGKSIPEIGEELGVSAILEGGVQRSGTQVRINVQLIDTSSDEHIWAEIYDRELTAANLFAIQTEIAETIARALKTNLSPVEQQRIRSTPTESLEAYEAYLLGSQRFAQRSAEGLADALTYFNKALEFDPGFALAWVGLADTYIELAGNKGFPTNKTNLDAQAAAEKALNLDQDLGEAYSSLGYLRLRQNELVEAKKYIERALELSPYYPPLSRIYGILLAKLGRNEESLEWTRAAVRLDPMSAQLRRAYAVALRSANRIEEAKEQLEIALEIDPLNPGARDAIATIEWQIYGQLGKALKHYHELIASDSTHGIHYAFLAQLYLDLANEQRSRVLRDRAMDLAPDTGVTFWCRLLFSLYTGGGKQIPEYANNVIANRFGAPLHLSFSVAQLSRLAIESGQPDQALAIYSDNYPELLREDSPAIHNGNYRAAIDLALTLKNTGDHAGANRLLELAWDFIQGRSRLGWWGGYWVADVRILALQGKQKEAISKLQLAVDEGWRSLWWYYLRLDPALESLHGEPEFKAALAQIEADMAAQMQRIREMERNSELTPIPGIEFEP